VIAQLRERIRRRRRPRSLALPRILRGFAAAHPRAFFVEIGSNDGLQHDHLRPFILDREWRGLMVEPVPYIFARLERNYAGIDRVTLVNAAIAAGADGELPFFHLRDAPPEERAALPDWYDGIGSFSRDAVLSHAPHMPDIAERIVEARVPAYTFDSLLERHGAPDPDLVVIDTEGYDAEIIASIDFDRHRPELLLYEHYHLDEPTRASTRASMSADGYQTVEEGFDTICARSIDLSRFAPGVPGIAKYEETA
jgi:FkbM family methyltransferase